MFWESLILFEKIFFVIACVGSGLLLIQFILTLIGALGDGDFDMGDIEGDGALGLFSIKGILAFFAVGGWVILACSKGGLHWAWSLIIGIVCGFIALIFVGLLYRFIGKMQSSGTLDPTRAVGTTAEVYLTIPSSGNGHGKISLTVSGKLIEGDAITSESAPIKTGSFVVVKSIQGDFYVVESAPLA